METEMEERRPERPTSIQLHTAVHGAGKNQYRGYKAKRPATDIEGGVATSRSKNGLDVARGSRQPIDNLPETVVALYPPADIDTYSSRRTADYRLYYSGDSTISSIKCVMSTVLFLAVVAAIVVVAFVKNPGM